jgi:MFS family permease
VLVIAVALAVLVPGIWGYTLIDPWETHYGEVAREMLARNDWISTWWAQDGWFWSKPILNFWAQGLSFAAFGVAWGAWQAILPDLAGRFELSSGPLGVMLTAGFAVSLPAMLLTGRLLDRIGPGPGIATTAAIMAAGLAVVGTLASVPVLVIGIVLFVVGSGAFDVAINGAGMGHATWSRPARLTLLHACFSGGGMAGALAAGAVLGSGVAFTAIYPGLAVLLAATAVVALQLPRADAAPRGGVPRAIAAAMVPLAGLAALAFLAEGSMETWSAIYLRDVLGAAAFVGALGPAAFHAAMLVGRLIGAGVAGSLGAPATLLVSGGMTVLGMAVALVVPVAAVAIAGMAVAALGASFVVPVVVSLAGRRAGAFAGRAASWVLSLGYAGFLVGPSLVGVLGEIAGLRIGLAVIPLAAMAIVLASRTRIGRA